MFLHIKKLVVLTLALFCISGAMAADTAYKENEHYKVISDKVLEHKEVREFFSFWCGHCFSLQKPYHYVAEHLPEGTKFVPSPVSILGGPMGVRSQYGHALAQLHGIEQEYTETLFRQMHVEGNIPRDESYFKDLFASLGIPNNKYDNEINSFAVMSIITKTNNLVEEYKLDAVPEIVVNGKYLVLQESVNNVSELSKLVNYLVTIDDAKGKK